MGELCSLPNLVLRHAQDEVRSVPGQQFPGDLMVSLSNHEGALA